MNDAPEIAPEIRGLLEEIVADPRSSMRLAPKRALRSWFDGGTARAREVSATKLERHLIEVHREALADLLREAAMIAYWKAPGFAHKPVGPDGRMYDPVELEPGWRERAEVHVRMASQRDPAVDLLAGCLRGPSASQAQALATCSLSLVSDDRTRFYLGLTVLRAKPRVALSILHRLLQRRPVRTVADEAFLLLGATLCALERFQEAREAYVRTASNESVAVYGRIYSFNLSCFLGDDVEALQQARELDVLPTPNDEVLLAVRDLLRSWAATRTGPELERARSALGRISHQIPLTARVVSEAVAP